MKCEPLTFLVIVNEMCAAKTYRDSGTIMPSCMSLAESNNCQSTATRPIRLQLLRDALTFMPIYESVQNVLFWEGG